MAKIGNSWLWKAHKRIEIRHEEQASLEPVYRERHYCLRADRTLLQKQVCAFPSHFDDGKLERNDFGWKVYGKVKPEHLHTAADNLRAKGFEIEYP